MTNVNGQSKMSARTKQMNLCLIIQNFLYSVALIFHDLIFIPPKLLVTAQWCLMIHEILVGKKSFKILKTT